MVIKDKRLSLVIVLFFVFMSFSLVSACVCGDGIIEENEECDNGLLNGNVCSPLYESSCTYCSTTCKLITVTGPRCGDGTCSDDETCSTCASDCGACPTVCGNNIKEGDEECDKGLLNGFLCWAEYGGTCDYCSDTCKIKTLTNYCGDGIVNSYCEECDDGNDIDDDYCTNLCKINEPEPVCDHEIAVRYSYSNSYGTGIAVGYSNGTWISDGVASLEKTGDYKIKYFVDNKKEADDNIHHVLKLEGAIIVDEYELTNEYFSKEINLELSSLTCDSYYTLTVDVTSDGYECDLSDNYASREIYIECEEEPPEEYCGDGICNNDETCSTCPEDCGECEEDCSEYCYSCPLGECDLNEQCGDGIIQEGEECDDGNSNNFDGCSKMCFIEQEKEKTVKNNNFVKYCEPNWKCSGWGECVNGEMTRKCVDENRCSFSYDKPLESSSCYNEVLSRSYVEQRTTIWAWIVIQIIIFLVLIFILVKLLI
jgi:cysteine-rich repeat protein